MTRWFLLVCLALAACGGPPLPPGLTPEQQESIKAARLVEQVGRTAEGAGYLLTSLSGTLATLGEAGLVAPTREIAIQTALKGVARNFDRRVESLREALASGKRPPVANVMGELRTDVDDLLETITAIPDVSARAELRALALALRLTVVTMDIQGVLP